MAGPVALIAEVLGCFDDARAESHLPYAVDGDAGGERILAVDEPTGQTEAIGGSAFGQWVQRGGHEAFDAFAGLVVSSPNRNVGGGALWEFTHNHHGGNGTFEGFKGSGGLIEPGAGGFDVGRGAEFEER